MALKELSLYNSRMILHYIPKDNLRQHWEYIRHGLEIVRSKGHTEYIPEDVYCDCYE